MLLRRFFGLLITLGVMSGVAAAAPVVVNADVEGGRTALAAQALLTRIHSRGTHNSQESGRAAQLLEQSERLLAFAETQRIQLSPAIQLQLQRASERLQEAVAQADANITGLRVAKAITSGGVTGTVTDASTGLPLAGVNVRAWDFTTQQSPSGAGIVASQNTNASGVFSLTLPAGKYHVRTQNAGAVAPMPGFVNQAFDGVSCADNLYCARYVGTIITVIDAATVNAVNFALPRAGAISGTLRKASDSTPIGGVTMLAVSENGFATAVTTTSSLAGSIGTYQLNGLPPGRYRVFTSFDPASLLQNTVHNNRACGSDDCYTVPVDYVTVVANAVTGAIDLSAPQVASVSGQIVTDLAAPLAGAFVYLISEDGWTYASAAPAPSDPNGASTDATGNYTFPQVRPGNYRLYVNAPGYLSEVYPNTRCANPVTCDALAVGGVISVPAATAMTGLNMSLAVGARISGTVTRVANGTPVQGIRVGVGNSALGFVSDFVLTDAAGDYALTGLPDAALHVFAIGSGDVADTAFGNVVCPAAEIGGCLNTGPTLLASSLTPLSGVNIAMATGGTLTGTISDGLVGAPTPAQRTRAEIFAVPAPGQPQSPSYTYLVFQTASGSFTASGLAPGAYKVIFASSSVVGWIDTAFGGAPCPRGGCDQSVLPSVFVTAGATTTGINGTLNRGRVIRGSITDALTGLPVRARPFDPSGGSSNLMAFYTNVSNYAGFGQVDAAGGYISRTGFSPGPLFAGTFLLRNNAPFGGNYIDEIYNDIACPWLSCGGTTGAALTVAASDLSGVDFALTQGAKLSGTVTRSSDSAPLESVLIEAFNGAGNKVAQARSNPLGGYTLYGLPTGSYYVTTSNQLGYLDEVYNNVTCEPFCNPVTGALVSVAAPATTSGINFSLAQSASVSGTVSDGGPAANVAVEIYGAIGNFLRATTSSALGFYQFNGLTAGRFYVRTRNASGRADALYNGLPCVGAACQVRSGTPINLLAGGSATSVNLALSAPGVISGQITDQATTNAISGVSVQLLNNIGAVALTTTSNAGGTYQFNSLATGNYYVVTRNTPTYIDESFNNVPCPAACDGLNGSAIAVTAGATSTANFQLSQGASISGTVRSDAVTPVPGAVVQVYNASGVPVGQLATNASGNYQINSLPDGNFFLRSQNSLGFIDEVYNNRPCTGYCDLLNGDAVAISAATSVGLIDFLLAPGGSISGTVTASVGGAGIPIATVQAFDVNGLPAGSATTDAAGAYSIRGLKNGSYKIRTLNTAGFVNQIHSGQSCSPTPCLLSAATPINVTGGPISGINFSLARGGTISGTATDQFNNPLPTGNAILYNGSGIEVANVAITDGSWEFNGLANGTYFVLIENNVGLIDQLFANVPCSAGSCNIAAVGTPIVLSGSTIRLAMKSIASNAAIDLALATGQTISGRIRDAGSNAPLNNATVYFFDSVGNLVGDGSTNALGDFTSTGGFAAGTYYAATANGVSRGVGNGYVNALYSGSNCLLGCVVSNGSVITVAATPVTGINFNLTQGIGFAGTVLDGNANPLALVTVSVVDSAGRAAGTFSTDSLGQYQADGLPPGTYFARSINSLGLADRLYGGAACVGNCNVLTGTPIVINNGNQPQNINFTLTLPTTLFGNGFE